MEDNSKKVELVIQALQQRIGEIVSQYETQIAVYRAEITQLIEKTNANTQEPQKTEDK